MGTRKKLVATALVATAGLGGALAYVGCNVFGDPTAAYNTCDPVDASAWAPRLSETGLYASIADGTLAEHVQPYTPNFPLWTDGAEKKRWFYLPPGSTIDTTDPDDWRYPVGTKFWKEFGRDGVRIETRLLEKVGPGDEAWAAIAYLWNEDQSDAIAVPQGVNDTHGTTHDVPAAPLCAGCHDGRASRVLGFSAIQLGGTTTDPTLSRLVAAGRLSHPLPANLQVPGDDNTREALGYLHANCGHCHNSDRPVVGTERCYDPENGELNLWLSTNALGRPEDTAAYQTVVRGGLADPSDPEDSWLMQAIDGRGEPWLSRMPPVGVEQLDPTVRPLLQAWIATLGR